LHPRRSRHHLTRTGHAARVQTGHLSIPFA
jgi:hypothetical protein